MRDVSDKVKAGTKPMCNYAGCDERTKRYECYNHAYLLCSKYPEPPQDLINQLNLDNETRR